MQTLFGKHEYIPVSISQLTNNGGRADPNRTMGGDEVVEVRSLSVAHAQFVKVIIYAIP